LITGPVAWKPAVGALAYGVVSGGLFITAMLILGIFPFQVYITARWSQVLLSTLSSVVICMVLYQPVKSVYERTGKVPAVQNDRRGEAYRNQGVIVHLDGCGITLIRHLEFDSNQRRTKC